MNASKFQAIETAIKDIIEELAPNAVYIEKYGGEVIAPDPSDEKSTVGGIFCYTHHASFEFTAGAFLDDPDGHLEGSGKMRRHLKFRSVDDVELKNVRYFLGQAL